MKAARLRHARSMLPLGFRLMAGWLLGTAAHFVVCRTALFQ